MKVRKRILYLVIAVAAVCMGFIRDYVFLNFNAQIHFLDGYHYNYTHEGMMWLDSGGYSIGQIVAMKWVSTVLFTLFFLLLTLWALWLVWHDRKYLRIAIWLYIALFIFSGLSYAVGTELMNSYFGYRFARIFMGFAQSPVPLMILLPAFYLYKRGIKTNAQEID